MKIALGTAKALEYLHDQANPQVIYRNLSPSNILLDNDYNAKLSDFGISKPGPFHGDGRVADERVQGTYFTPEYTHTGLLSLKTDVFCFGLILLDLISRQQAREIASAYTRQTTTWHSLLCWILETPKRVLELVDPTLRHDDARFRRFYRALEMVKMCVQENPVERPVMSDVVSAIGYIFSSDDLNSPLEKEASSLGRV